MPESAEEIYARVQQHVGPDGRLPTPPYAEWDIFPWQPPVVPKVLAPPVEVEPPRAGEGDRPCSCAAGEPEHAIWRNDRWAVTSLGAPSGMPLVVMVMLMPHEHLDLDDLDDELAADLGRVSVRLHRMTGAMDHVGRVHVQKIGDGGARLLVWFMRRRPVRRRGVTGSRVPAVCRCRDDPSASLPAARPRGSRRGCTSRRRGGRR